MEVSGTLNSFVLWPLYCQRRGHGAHWRAYWVCPKGCLWNRKFFLLLGIKWWFIIHPACILVTLLSMQFQPISHMAILKLLCVMVSHWMSLKAFGSPSQFSLNCVMNVCSTVSPLHVIFSLERQWVKTLYIKSHKIENKYMQKYQFHYMKI